MSALLLSFAINSGVKNGNQLFGGVVACVLGCFFLYDGLIRRPPLSFNPFNPWKKPLSVRSARIVFIPAAVLCFLFGLREIIRALR